MPDGEDMTLDDRVLIGELLGEYGALLTDKQRNTLDLYCSMDFSLQEVADEYGVSRQAVRDIIVRAVALLEQYESKLGALRLRRNLIAVLGDGTLTAEQRVAAAVQLLED